MSDITAETQIPDNITRAAMIALNRAIDAFYEAEAGHRMRQAAKVMQAYSQQTAQTCQTLHQKAHVAWDMDKAKDALVQEHQVTHPPTQDIM